MSRKGRCTSVGWHKSGTGPGGKELMARLSQAIKFFKWISLHTAKLITSDAKKLSLKKSGNRDLNGMFPFLSQNLH